MSEHDKTQPWKKSEFIILQNGRGVAWKLCYKASRTDARIYNIAIPGNRVFNMPSFMEWAHLNGWQVSFPTNVHVDVA